MWYKKNAMFMYIKEPTQFRGCVEGNDCQCDIIYCETLEYMDTD